MATVNQFIGYIAVATSLLPLGCNKAVGLSGAVTPLAQIHVQVTGDLPPEVASDSGQLHLALVWGLQWQPEPFCVVQAVQPESPAVAAVVADGCPDNLRFVPNLVAADVPFQPGTPATLDLPTLPTSDVMVGDLSARIAYGSLIVYDDVNQNGALDLRTPPRFRRRNQPPVYDDAGVAGPRDLVFGASFVSMTLPDTRVAFREGAFDRSVAFYPRAGCADPPAGFSILSAGGFSPADTNLLLAGQLPVGQFPAETSCATAAIGDLVTLQTQPTADLSQLACAARDGGGGTNYTEAPKDEPVLTGHAWACASFPHIPGDDAGVATGKQLVVASAPSEPCRYLVHYTLRGCDNDPACALPSWDITATPPSWWSNYCPP